MKKVYEYAKLEIVDLDSRDLIFTSEVEEEGAGGGASSGSGGTYYPAGSDSEDSGYSDYH